MLLDQFLRDEELTLKDLAGRLPPLHELIREYKVSGWVGWWCVCGMGGAGGGGWVGG